MISDNIPVENGPGVFDLFKERNTTTLDIDNFNLSEPPLETNYKNDEEMIYLQVVNSLLDEFIEENLNKWFDKKYIVYLEERAKEIADEISNKK